MVWETFQSLTEIFLNLIPKDIKTFFWLFFSFKGVNIDPATLSVKNRQIFEISAKRQNAAGNRLAPSKRSVPTTAARVYIGYVHT